MIIAGRRVDAEDTAAPQFPLSCVPVVAASIVERLKALHVTTLVCSAACGVDLLAIQAAATLGARQRIVLPFAPERFKRTSVTDRPGNWDALYDPAIQRSAKTGDLIVLNLSEGERAYLDVNQRVVDEARQAAGSDGAHGVFVWDGARPAGLDVTADLARRAARADFVLHAIPILAR